MLTVTVNKVRLYGDSTESVILKFFRDKNIHFNPQIDGSLDIKTNTEKEILIWLKFLGFVPALKIIVGEAKFFGKPNSKKDEIIQNLTEKINGLTVPFDNRDHILEINVPDDKQEEVLKWFVDNQFVLILPTQEQQHPAMITEVILNGSRHFGRSTVTKSKLIRILTTIFETLTFPYEESDSILRVETKEDEQYVVKQLQNIGLNLDKKSTRLNVFVNDVCLIGKPSSTCEKTAEYLLSFIDELEFPEFLNDRKRLDIRVTDEEKELTVFFLLSCVGFEFCKENDRFIIDYKNSRCFNVIKHLQKNELILGWHDDCNHCSNILGSDETMIKLHLHDMKYAKCMVLLKHLHDELSKWNSNVKKDHIFGWKGGMGEQHKLHFKNSSPQHVNFDEVMWDKAFEDIDQLCFGKETQAAFRGDTEMFNCAKYEIYLRSIHFIAKTINSRMLLDEIAFDILNLEYPRDYPNEMNSYIRDSKKWFDQVMNNQKLFHVEKCEEGGQCFKEVMILRMCNDHGFMENCHMRVDKRLRGNDFRNDVIPNPEELERAMRELQLVQEFNVDEKKKDILISFNKFHWRIEDICRHLGFIFLEQTTVSLNETSEKTENFDSWTVNLLFPDP